MNILENGQTHPIVKVYPNPTKDFINLDFGTLKLPVDITIKNSLGQVVLTENSIVKTKYTLKFDMPEGIYFLNIKEYPAPIKIIKN